MPGLGTIVNVIAIAAAGVIGCLAGERIAPRFQDTLMKATTIAVLFLGLGGTMAQMLTFKHGSFNAGNHDADWQPGDWRTNRRMAAD